jgi:hypothetical protein
MCGLPADELTHSNGDPGPVQPTLFTYDTTLVAAALGYVTTVSHVTHISESTVVLVVDMIFSRGLL